MSAPCLRSTTYHSNQDPLHKRILISAPNALTKADGPKKTAQLITSVVSLAGTVANLPQPVVNLGGLCGTAARGFGVLGVFSNAHSLANRDRNDHLGIAKDSLLLTSSVIDGFNFVGRLGFIPMAKVSHALGKIPVIGKLTGSIGAAPCLNVLQGALVVAATACSIASNVKKMKACNKVKAEAALKFAKWNERVEVIKNFEKDILPLTDVSSEEQRDRAELFVRSFYDKYNNKITAMVSNYDILVAEAHTLSHIAKKTKKESQREVEVLKELKSLAQKSVRYQQYVEITNDVRPIEEKLLFISDNYKYKANLHKTFIKNAEITKRKSIFSLVADICKIAVVVFATIASILFPVLGFGLSITIGVLSLLSSSTGLVKFIQDKLFNKTRILPERPRYTDELAKILLKREHVRYLRNNPALAA